MAILQFHRVAGEFGEPGADARMRPGALPPCPRWIKQFAFQRCHETVEKRFFAGLFRGSESAAQPG